MPSIRRSNLGRRTRNATNQANYRSNRTAQERDDRIECERIRISQTRELNFKIQEQITGESRIYKSVDSATNQDDLVNYPPEFLNSLDLPGLPPHNLQLKELVEHRIPPGQWFTPASLMSNCPQLKAIIDLTDTDRHADRYYSPQEFLASNIEHLKVRIRGGGLIPEMGQLRMFSDAVDGFVKKFSDDPDALIGVHCTHGLNRTGYFICKYMVTRMNCEPTDAIAKFQKARGYEIYRKNYIDEILTPGVHSHKPQRPDYRRPRHSIHPVGTHHDLTNNWRHRDPNATSGSGQNWKHCNRGRRQQHHRGNMSRAFTSRRNDFKVHNRGPTEMAHNDMEYKSPIGESF